MRVNLGTTKDTPADVMRYLLDLPSMETRHKVEQVKAYLKNPLHDAVKEGKGCRLDLLDLSLLIPCGTKGHNNTPPANSILADPL